MYKHRELDSQIVRTAMAVAWTRTRELLAMKIKTTFYIVCAARQQSKEIRLWAHQSMMAAEGQRDLLLRDRWGVLPIETIEREIEVPVLPGVPA
jgi:hypothetical protein